MIPPLADCYQTRPETDLLAQATASGETAVLTQVLAGLGGVGKSQLAAAYVHHRAATVDVLVWVDARSPDTIITTYARAPATLGRARDVDHPVTAAQEFLTWLQNSGDRSRLVVLDDLVDPAHLQGWWPTGPHGTVVVTTRRADSALFTRGRRRVPVGVYEPDQAIAYLTDKLDTAAGSLRMVEADRLAADLGYCRWRRFRLPSVAPSLPGSRPRPAGWPTASPDPGCGRHPRTAAGTRSEERTSGHKIRQITVSTLLRDG